jgi:hypothetical protein
MEAMTMIDIQTTTTTERRLRALADELLARIDELQAQIDDLQTWVDEVANDLLDRTEARA